VLEEKRGSFNPGENPAKVSVEFNAAVAAGNSRSEIVFQLLSLGLGQALASGPRKCNPDRPLQPID
jgi:hypothetical protein